MNHKLLSALMCSLAVIACDKETRNNQDPMPKDQGISFIGQIGASSRATDTGFEKGDAISVYAIKKTTSNPSGTLQATNYADNAKFVYENGLFVAADVPSVIEQPTDGSPLFYKAVYPYSANVGNAFSFAVKTDQSTGTNYTASDLMVAETVATTELKPELTFNHRLSNILLEVRYEEKPAGSEELYFNNVKVNASVNLTNNTFTSTGTTTNVKASPCGTNLFRVVLPPQSIVKGAGLITLKVGGKTYQYNAHEDLTWRSGMQYSYYATVKKNGTITFTAKINPWRTEPVIENVIPEDLVNKMSEKITIYRGTTPPIIEGCYFIDPFVTVYCEDGYYKEGDVINSEIIRFMNQDNVNFTLDYEGKSAAGKASDVGTGAFISGSGNNFSVFFSTIGTYVSEKENTIEYKTALIISGTKSSSGIKNLYYAFVMIEKSGDVDGEVMAEGSYRVFKDGDGLSVNYTWSSTSSAPQTKSDFTFSPNYELIRAK